MPVLLSWCAQATGWLRRRACPQPAAALGLSLLCRLLSITVPLLLLLVPVFTQDHLADPYHVTFATNGVSVPFLHN